MNLRAVPNTSSPAVRSAQGSPASDPDRGQPMLPQASVLGTPVTVCTFVQAQDELSRLVSRGSAAYVSCANAYSATLATDLPDFAAVLAAADMVTADGMAVVWALHAMGHAQAERVHNDDLFLACCARFPRWRHFLVGGRDGQTDQVAAAMRARFPGIQIAGGCATPLRPVPAEHQAQILALIRQNRPDIVWVGMGTPAQDHWMQAVAPQVDLPMVGVGSLFDLLAGRTRAAPQWVKRSGLQWAFRLMQEPRRLAGRYIVYNSRFVWGLACQWRRHGRKDMHG
jgi:N-acetylglucosaminyldiphosphoundecaprenol N-acetyl-beta-D-mannosaminyltransferase